LKKEYPEKIENTDPVINFAPGIVSPESTLLASVDAYEKQLILKVLEDNQWHRGKAAAALGIHRRTLFKKIKKYRIDHSQIENVRSQ
jgi:DNA-binding NtrC family response regulator